MTPPSNPFDMGGWPVVPALVELAGAWPATYSTHPDDDRTPAPPPLRCDDLPCGQEIWPPSLQGRLSHLLCAHGYRMNGVSYDEHNQVVTTAAEELIARARG